MEEDEGLENGGPTAKDSARWKVIADKYRVGRIQRQIRRAFIAHGGSPLNIGQFLEWAYPASERHPIWHRTNVHRALRRFAVSLGRIPDRPGRPCVWAPTPELKRRICPTL